MKNIHEIHRFLITAAVTIAYALDIRCPSVQITTKDYGVSGAAIPSLYTVVVRISEISDAGTLDALHALISVIRSLWQKQTGIFDILPDKETAKLLSFIDAEAYAAKVMQYFDCIEIPEYSADSSIQETIEDAVMAYSDSVVIDRDALRSLKFMVLPILERAKAAIKTE